MQGDSWCRFDRQRAQQAAEDAAKKAAIAARNLVDATKEAEEASIAAAAVESFGTKVSMLKCDEDSPALSSAKQCGAL